MTTTCATCTFRTKFNRGICQDVLLNHQCRIDLAAIAARAAKGCDGIIPTDIDVALIDVQGAEIRVLKGGEAFLQLPSLNGLIMEISHHELYKGLRLVPGAGRAYSPTQVLPQARRIQRLGWADAVFLKRRWPETEGETPLLAALATTLPRPAVMNNWG